MFSYNICEDTELRMLEERHAEQLFALIEHNRERLPWLSDSYSLEETRNSIKRGLEKYANNKGFKAGIWHKGVLVGSVAYNIIDWENESTSLGYWLSAPFEGKGLVTKACRALIDHAFKELRLNRIEIRCASENRRSRAIPEKLGFTQEGTLRQAERHVDLIVYGLLASEWEVANNPEP